MNILERTLKMQEKKMKEKEQIAIQIKAQYIMRHSRELLKKMEDEDFVNTLAGYLLSNEIEPNDVAPLIHGENEYSYFDSICVIFKTCALLPALGYTKDECENFRNKLRLYTKFFPEHSIEDTINNKKLVKIDNKKVAGIINN